MRELIFSSISTAKLHPNCSLALHEWALHEWALHGWALHGWALHEWALHEWALHGWALHGWALHEGHKGKVQVQQQACFFT